MERSGHQDKEGVEIWGGRRGGQTGPEVGGGGTGGSGSGEMKRQHR